MTRKVFIAVAAVCLGVLHAPQAEAPEYPFFALCMDTHDSEKRTLQQQAALLKDLGYAGAGHVGLDKVQERLETLSQAGLKLFQVYVRVSIAPDTPPYDPRLEATIPLLKDHDAMVALLIGGRPPSDTAGDARAVALIQDIADKARGSGVRVVLYPHVNDWLERVEDAVRVAQKVDRPNVGIMFNLCHWLRVDEEKNLKPLLAAARPYLFAVSLHGADHATDIRAGTGQWIQPLDSGAFNVYTLLEALRELDYRGPIGLQCWGLRGDARDHLTRSMAAWRTFTTRLAASPPDPAQP